MDETTVRDQRLRLGITIEETALLAFVSYPVCCRLDRGLIPLTPRLAARLAPVFGVTEQALMAGQAALQEQVREELQVSLAGGRRGEVPERPTRGRPVEPRTLSEGAKAPSGRRRGLGR